MPWRAFDGGYGQISLRPSSFLLEKRIVAKRITLSRLEQPKAEKTRPHGSGRLIRNSLATSSRRIIWNSRIRAPTARHAPIAPQGILDPF
jgi:hypothetical protein